MFDDLRTVGVSILTIGQYLRPSPKHARMARYYHPDEFAALKRSALDEGIRARRVGPLVRSSYHAHEQADAFQARCPAENRASAGRWFEPMLSLHLGMLGVHLGMLRFALEDASFCTWALGPPALFLICCDIRSRP